MTTHLTRRAIARSVLAGVVALPVASLPTIAADAVAAPAIAKLPDAPKPEADTKLIELYARLEKAVADAEAFRRGPLAKVSRLYDKLCPPRPEPWFEVMPAKIAKTVPEFRTRLKPPPGEPRKFLTANEYAIMKKYCPKHPAVVWTDEKGKAERKIHAAFGKRSHAAAEKSGVVEADEKWSALLHKSRRLCDKIVRTPAHSIVGLQIKVKAMRLIGDVREEHDSPLGKAWMFAQKDILSLRA